MTNYIQSKQSLAEPAETEMLGCSFSHWHRLKGRVTQLGNPRGSYETWATFFFGVAAASVLALFAETASQSREGWMQVLYVVVAVAFAICGFVIHTLTNDVNERRIHDAKDIVDEMDLIEETWVRSAEKGSTVE